MNTVRGGWLTRSRLRGSRRWGTRRGSSASGASARSRKSAGSGRGGWPRGICVSVRVRERSSERAFAPQARRVTAPAPGLSVIEWYYLERSRALLRRLGEAEPQLPPFDPSKVPPVPFEKEICAAIERLRAE